MRAYLIFLPSISELKNEVSGGSSSVSGITFDDSLVYTKTSSSNGGAQEGLNGPGGH